MEDTLSAPEEKQELPKQDMTKILLETSLGNITIALYNETPLHRDNFIKLVKEHYYDGLLFHRVIPQFMIQGGDPSSKNAPAGQPLGQGGPGYTIPAEIQPTLYHKRGAVAAARMGDQVNPTKASSGSQFYIVDGRVFPTEQLEKTRTATGAPFTNEQKNVYSTIGGAPHLDGAYTVFGEVISGMDVVDKIAAQPKDRMDRPQKDIVIRKATILENK
ncbi:MAG: peptidylprolyl isomerase [Bacteroidales bacterium]|nr:peptidylprolyl isomerase [Bacteroidales bacterium]